MVSGWWLIVEFAVMGALTIYTNRVNYRTGIWDGAFNHALPTVQREMLRYDERRAREILNLTTT